MEPNIGELWVTKSGRLAIIVRACNQEAARTIQHIENADPPWEWMSMLWWDDVDEEWTVSSILDRLDHKYQNGESLDPINSGTMDALLAMARAS